MLGSMMYGILVGLGFYALARVAPQPAGSLLCWSLIAVQLVRGAAITWRRTHLPFATTSMLSAAASASIIATATWSGYTFPLLPITWSISAFGLLAVAGGCMLLESSVHPREWSQWKTFMDGKSVWDIALGRHIPELPRQ